MDQLDNEQLASYMTGKNQLDNEHLNDHTTEVEQSDNEQLNDRTTEMDQSENEQLNDCITDMDQVDNESQAKHTTVMNQPHSEQLADQATESSQSNCGQLVNYTLTENTMYQHESYRLANGQMQRDCYGHPGSYFGPTNHQTFSVNQASNFPDSGYQEACGFFPPIPPYSHSHYRNNCAFGPSQFTSSHLVGYEQNRIEHLGWNPFRDSFYKQTLSQQSQLGASSLLNLRSNLSQCMVIKGWFVLPDESPPDKIQFCTNGMNKVGSPIINYLYD